VRGKEAARAVAGVGPGAGWCGGSAARRQGGVGGARVMQRGKRERSGGMRGPGALRLVRAEAGGSRQGRGGSWRGDQGEREAGKAARRARQGPGAGAATRAGAGKDDAAARLSRGKRRRPATRKRGRILAGIWGSFGGEERWGIFGRRSQI
jgi:hypothetical protein